MDKLKPCSECGEKIIKDKSKPWRKHYCKVACEHFEFECFCNVNRILDKDDKVRFTVDIQVKCRKCEKPFVFIGLPMGLLHDSPTMGAFGYEARLPIKAA